jgi:hypothetical protein
VRKGWVSFRQAVLMRVFPRVVAQAQSPEDPRMVIVQAQLPEVLRRVRWVNRSYAALRIQAADLKEAFQRDVANRCTRP